MSYVDEELLLWWELWWNNQCGPISTAKRKILNEIFLGIWNLQRSISEKFFMLGCIKYVWPSLIKKFALINSSIKDINFQVWYACLYHLRILFVQSWSYFIEFYIFHAIYRYYYLTIIYNKPRFPIRTFCSKRIIVESLSSSILDFSNWHKK